MTLARSVSGTHAPPLVRMIKQLLVEFAFRAGRSKGLGKGVDNQVLARAGTVLEAELVFCKHPERNFVLRRGELGVVEGLVVFTRGSVFVFPGATPLASLRASSLEVGLVVKQAVSSWTTSSPSSPSLSLMVGRWQSDLVVVLVLPGRRFFRGGQ